MTVVGTMVMNDVFVQIENWSCGNSELAVMISEHILIKELIVWGKLEGNGRAARDWSFLKKRQKRKKNK